MAAASDHVRPWQRILIGGCRLDDYECTTVAAVRSCCQDFLKGYDELSAAESTDVEASAGLRLLADALLRPEIKFINVLTGFANSGLKDDSHRWHTASVRSQERLPPIRYGRVSESVRLTKWHRDVMLVFATLCRVFADLADRATEAGYPDSSKEPDWRGQVTIWRSTLAERFSKDGRVQVWHGSWFMGEKKPAEALVALQKGVELDPASCFNASFTVANLLTNMTDAACGDGGRYSSNQKQICAALRTFLAHAPECHWHTPRACMLLVRTWVQALVDERVRVNRGNVPFSECTEVAVPISEVAATFPSEVASVLRLYKRGLNAAALRNRWAPPEASE